MKTSRSVVVFTDGACSGNPGPGGWAAVVRSPDGRVRELAGGEPRTTNNRMEMRAVLEGLRAAPAGREVALYTDSTYVISGIIDWISGWKRKGWVRPDGTAILNRDLWEDLDALAAARGKEGKVSWHYVRGHSGFPGNERCDALSTAFAQREDPGPFYDGPYAGYGHDLSHLPQDTSVPKRSAGGFIKKPAGGMYLSFLNGRLERHATWAECEARVKGKSGARFKKVRSPAEEAQTLKSWGA